MSQYIRNAAREYVYQATIAELVLKKLQASAVAREFGIPASTIRSWVFDFEGKFPFELQARIAAEALLREYAVR